MATLAGVMIICALELQRSFSHLKNRTQLLLCVKETKGELNRYLLFMGRTNWGIKNINKIKWLMVFIPGLQGAAANAEQAKRLLISLQDSTLLLYLSKLAQLKAQGCSLDPRLLQTPFELSGRGYARDHTRAAKLRSTKWDYYFLHRPYGLTLNITSKSLEAINPTINYQVKENKVTSFFLSSSVW